MDSTQSLPNPLGTERIGKLLVRFAVPSVIAILVNSLYNLVDQIFIGHGVGMLGNAATNVAFPLTTICLAVSLLFGTGGAAGFSLALGSGNERRASQTAGTVITLLAASGLVITILVRLFLEPLVLAFGATPEVLPFALSYTGITSLGIPFLVLSGGMSHIIRADGSPRYSMMCMLVGAVLNTILDPIFIFVFDMGIAGAAWATIIGQIVSGAAALWYVKRFRSVKMTRAHFIPRLGYALSAVSLGMASSFNQLAMLAVQIGLNNTLTRYGAASVYGAEIPLACAGIAIKVNMLFFAFVLGISQASAPIVGYNYGAGKYDRVLKTYGYAAISVTVVSVLSFAIFQLFPRQLMTIFGDGDPMYFEFAARFFRIYLFCTFLNGIQPLTSAFFTSIGKATRGIVISLTRQILFLLPLILILPRFFGIEGILFAGPIADFAAFVLALFLVSRQRKAMKTPSVPAEAPLPEPPV